jgi:hypothetical protein
LRLTGDRFVDAKVGVLTNFGFMEGEDDVLLMIAWGWMALLVEGGVFGLSHLGRGMIVQLHEITGVEGFDCVGFAVSIDEFDLEGFGFVDFDDRSDLPLIEVLIG